MKAVQFSVEGIWKDAHLLIRTHQSLLERHDLSNQDSLVDRGSQRGPKSCCFTVHTTCHVWSTLFSTNRFGLQISVEIVGFLRRHLDDSNLVGKPTRRYFAPLSSAEVQWSIRGELLNRVSAGIGDNRVAPLSTSRYLCLHSFSSADSTPPKTPLDSLWRGEYFSITAFFKRPSLPYGTKRTGWVSSWPKVNND